MNCKSPGQVIALLVQPDREARSEGREGCGFQYDREVQYRKTMEGWQSARYTSCVQQARGDDQGRWRCVRIMVRQRRWNAQVVHLGMCLAAVGEGRVRTMQVRPNLQADPHAMMYWMYVDPADRTANDGTGNDVQQRSRVCRPATKRERLVGSAPGWCIDVCVWKRNDVCCLRPAGREWWWYVCTMVVLLYCVDVVKDD